MCTGIVHVYRCHMCSAVVYRLKEAAKGYTCYQARKNRCRGICRTGIDYSCYDRISEEPCLFCEIFLGGEVSDLTADTCDEGDEPWPEDREDSISFEMALAEDGRVEDGDTLQNHINQQGDDHNNDNNNDDDDEDDEDDEDDDDDNDEGGAKLC